MEKILFTNKNNQLFEADVVRYFKYGYDYYLIYTTGEIDEKGYRILYLVEVLEQFGQLISVNIKDETKWLGMQKIIKNIIREIKHGSKKIFEDLDYREVEKLKIVSPRFFKIDDNLVQILASSYLKEEEIENIFSEEQIEEIEFERLQTIQSTETVQIEEDHMEQEIKVAEPDLEHEIDYKALYHALKEEKDATDVLLDDLIEQLVKYRERYGEIE